jgi:hypothetical protein
MTSLTLNGSTDFARVATVVASMPMTFVAWAKPAAIGVLGNIMSISASGSNHGWRMLMDSAGRGQVGHTGPTNAAITTTVNAVSANAWGHFCNKFASNTSRRVILNGDTVNAASTATNSGAVASPVRTSIGVRDIDTPAGFFNGIIGACAIWNVELTDEECVALARGWNPRRVKGHALVFYAPFLTTGTIRDWFGNNMTVTGGTASTDGPPMALS